MPKKKKSIRKKILISIIICLIIVLVVFIAMKYFKKKEAEYIQPFDEFKKEFEEQTILPRNIYELYEYNGEYDREFLYKDLKVFADYISYLKDSVDLDNCKSFYDKYSQEILDILGISNFEKFKIFITEIQNENLNIEEFRYAEIEIGTSYRKNGYFHFYINLYYGEEPVKFDVAFAEKKRKEISVFYQVAE